MVNTSLPGQVYRFVSADGAWEAVGRTRVGQVLGFPSFTDLDVFNGTVLPTGSLDGGTQNVGCRIPRNQLTVVSGTFVAANGVTYKGLDIQGQVTTTSSTDQAFFVDCVIRGPSGATSQAAMAVGHAYNFGGTTFTYCTFDGTGRESMWTDCINGGNVTFNYCEFMRGVDGLGFNTVGNGIAYCCRLYHGHYESFWDSTAGAVRATTYTDFGGKVHTPPFIAQSSGDTHSDGCQIQGSAGWSVKGCFFGGPRATAGVAHLDPTVSADYSTMMAIDGDATFPNSCIIVNGSQSSGVPAVGALIEHNVFQGGAAKVNLNVKNASIDNLAGLTVRNNLFTRESYGFYIYANTGLAAAITNNLYQDDRTAVPVSFH